MRPQNHRESGNVLAVLVFAMLPLAALVLMGMQMSFDSSKELERRRESIKAASAAMSGIEIAKWAISNASYTDTSYAGRNEVIAAALESAQSEILVTSESGEHRFLDVENGTILYSATIDPWDGSDSLEPFRILGRYQVSGGHTATVSIVKLSSKVSALLSEVEIGAVKRTARCLVSEYDSFSRYSLFVDERGGQPISVRQSGDVHSNKDLDFKLGGWELAGRITAVQGFEFVFGASWDNVEFLGGYDEQADTIPMPTLTENRTLIRPSLGSLANAQIGGDYVFVGTNYKDSTVAFTGDSVIVNAQDSSTGTWGTIYSGSIDSINRIYIMPKISSLKGDINGRVTVASEGTEGITISDNLRYVDDNGNTAWVESTLGAGFDQNGDYQGNSILGVVALRGDIIYGNSSPDRLQVNASCFTTGVQRMTGLVLSSDYKYVLGYDSSFIRSYLFTFGGTVCSQGKIRGLASSATLATLTGFEDGEYLLDEKQVHNPPPYFPQLKRPVFKASYVVGTVSDV